ncbi:MAG: hypothetical protein WCF95_04120 [bacterium]
MTYISDLEQIRQDFLSFLELDHAKVNGPTRKNLLKGILSNFFDYLENKDNELFWLSEKKELIPKL